jgi:hypothetical protein
MHSYVPEDHRLNTGYISTQKYILNQLPNKLHKENHNI